MFPAALLSRADGLRKIRNPFSHRREAGDPDKFDTRFLARKQHPDLILEADAKEALDGMLAYKFSAADQLAIDNGNALKMFPNIKV